MVIRLSGAMSMLLHATAMPVAVGRLANALRPEQAAPDPASRPRLPLLVLVFTQRRNVLRRKQQRATWLGFRWLHGEVRRKPPPVGGVQPVGWRYVFVQAREASTEAGALDRVRGDVVTLSRVEEGYANLVYKTLEAVRWALAHVSFEALLKTDDDTLVHIGRAGAWLATHSQPSLYAGRVFWDSQVIRSNFSKADLRHPEWFPPDFAKWAVPYDAFASASGSYPPYCSGGGYLLGSAAAQMVVKRHDARRGAARPVVRVEDAYVGILAAESRLQPTDMAELVQDPPVGREQRRELFERQAS